MATAPPQLVRAGPIRAAKLARVPVPENIWRAPLVPVGLGLTAGIVFDRYFSFPLPAYLFALLAALAAAAAACCGRQAILAVLYFSVTTAAAAAAYHHWYRDIYPPDDIGEFAKEEPRPVKLQGFIAEEPSLQLHPKNDPLRSFSRADPTVSVLQVSRFHDGRDWRAASGRARLVVAGELQDIHVGDEVHVVGRLIKPSPPANPGEFDFASFLQDQRIRALVVVSKTPDGVTRLSPGWAWSPARMFPLVRGWGQQVLQETLPKECAGVAVALVLGDGSAMASSDWEKYVRTGVIHVLAISGQHLTILALFLWFVCRPIGWKRRHCALFIALFLLGYSLLAGGRPPVMRSAITVCAFALGLTLRRRTLAANSFALAWIVVAILNPTDIFNVGCQLSFLAVAVLYWGTSAWAIGDRGSLGRIFRDPPGHGLGSGGPLSANPVHDLIHENRPRWLRALYSCGRIIWIAYLTTLTVWLAIAPLVAFHTHVVSPVGIILGPPLVLLTATALLAGFCLLLLALVCWPLTFIPAFIITWSLSACEFLVDTAIGWRWGDFFVPDIPAWWLWVYYPCFLAVLVVGPLRQQWRWAVLAGLGWLCIGLVSGWARPATDELRCTFLAVGHGGCTVLETPDGRTLLYDAGAIGGPDVTRRQIAPYLWYRGIRRIDEIFLSHADLDHFNGLNDLLERFAVGQVSCTPTFADKKNRPVRFTLEAIRRHGVSLRIVRAGDILSAGAVTLHVLHPPAHGPGGKENFRSLVLLVQHAGHRILLTGDLEGPGMNRVQDLPPPHVDVLTA
jgi:competence protein ComEC